MELFQLDQPDLDFGIYRYAHKDQYNIKTSEYLRDYAFRPEMDDHVAHAQRERVPPVQIVDRTSETAVLFLGEGAGNLILLRHGQAACSHGFHGRQATNRPS